MKQDKVPARPDKRGENRDIYTKKTIPRPQHFFGLQAVELTLSQLVISRGS